MPFTGAGAFQEIGVRAVVKDIGRFMTDLGRMDKAVQTTGQKLGTRLQGIGAGMQNIGRSMTMGLTLPIVAVGGLALKASIDFESAFAGVRKTVDATEEEFATLRQGIRDMAKEMPASVAEISKVAEAAGALGIAKSYILDFSRTMIDMGETTDLTADEAAMAMARIANIMQMPQDEFDNLGSAIVDLGNKGASTEREIVDMALRIAGAGKVVGLTEAQVVGFASAMASVGIEAEMGGSAVSRVFMEMSKSMAEADERTQLFAATAGMTVPAFAELFKRDAAEAMISFMEGLGGVVDAGGNVFGLMEDLELGGIRVQDTLLRASGAGQLFRDQLQIGSQAWKENTALAAEAEKRYATTSAKLEMLRNRVMDAAITLGDALLPTFKDAIQILEGFFKFLGKVAQAFAGLPKPVRMAIVSILLLVAALGPLLMILGPIISMVGTLIILLSTPGAMAGLVTTIGLLGGALSVAMPWILATIGVTLVLISLAPLMVAAWGPVSEFFAKALPRALASAGTAWRDLPKLLLTPLTQLASMMRKLGQDIGMGVARGLADAAEAIFEVARQIAEGIAYLLNPKNIVWGSTLEQVYAKAGRSAFGGFFAGFGKLAAKTVMAAPVVAVPGDPTYEPGGRMPGGAPPVSEWMPQRDEVPALRAKVDVELGDTSALDDLEGKAADAGEEAGEAGGNAFLRMLEGVVARGLGTVTTAMAAPLDALRGVVSSLADEIMRLAGLPTIESAMERLQRGQLQLKLIGVERREPQIQAARDRIAAIDEEEKALLDQRQAIIDENWGREEGVEAIDAQLAALEKEQDQKESVIDKYEAEKQAIEDQIAALDSLAKERDAEREVMAARAQLADKTLATDKEVLSAMERMQPVISEVTGLINKQADDLWTRFVPAWEDAAAAAGAGAGAGAGLGGLGAGVGEVGPIEPPAPVTAEEIEFPDMTKAITDWVKSWRIVTLLAGLGLIVGVIAAAIFGWPVLLTAAIAMAIGAIVGLIIKYFGDDIMAGFKWLGKKIGKFFSKLFDPEMLKKIAKIAVLVLMGPAGLLLLVAKMTGIKDKVLGVIQELKVKAVQLFEGLVSTIKTLVSGLVTSVTGFFSGMVTTIKTTVSGMVTAVVGFVTTLVTDITTKISGMVTSVVTFFTNLATGVLTTVSGLVTDVVNFFIGLPGAILGALGDLGGLLWQAGVDLMGGLWDGLMSVAGTVAGIAAGIANAVIDAVNWVIEELNDFLEIEICGPFGMGCVDLNPPDIPTIPHVQRGWWKVPGAGSQDSVPAVLAPGEMVVPRDLAEKIRGIVGGFACLGRLVANAANGAVDAVGKGAAESFGQLGAVMAGQATPLGASRPMAMAGALSVSAPISVTVYSHDWGEVRRIVHAEVDTALSQARDSTTRQAAELTSGIV